MRSAPRRRSTPTAGCTPATSATIDAEGYGNIVGRVKDMLIRGGENVYPREVEEFLFRHPKVAQVQVFGVPDPKYGEEVCAWVVLKPGTSADRGGDPRLLPRPDRPLQGAALRPLRDRAPDDRHRQGAEIRDARADGRAARPDRSADRLSLLPPSTGALPMTARPAIDLALTERIDAAAQAAEAQVVAWRRDFHQHPELGNREFRTAAIVAEHLRASASTRCAPSVAHTGVVGLLQGRPARPGGRAARRHGRAAGDRGGRPAVRVARPRASGTARRCGVMHACGHDCHTAILMGVARCWPACAPSCAAP